MNTTNHSTIQELNPALLDHVCGGAVPLAALAAGGFAAGAATAFVSEVAKAKAKDLIKAAKELFS